MSAPTSQQLQSINPFRAITTAFLNGKPSADHTNLLLDLLMAQWESSEQLTTCLSAYATGRTQDTAAHLYTVHIGHISNAVLSECRLNREDVGHILDDVARRLSEYKGEAMFQGFEAWCDGIIGPLKEFYAMRRENLPFARAGLWSVLNGCADLGFTMADFQVLENDVWLKVFQKQAELLTPGTAKISTRIFGMARFVARGWRTDRLRKRHNAPTMGEAIRAEEGYRRPRPVVLGPGDVGAYATPEHVGIADLDPYDRPLEDEQFNKVV